MNAQRDGNDDTEEASPRQRIIDAALEVFSEKGFENASTLGIATQARVSKRDIYTHFGSKQEMLVASISNRVAQMKLATELPRATSLPMLETVLVTFGIRLLTEVSSPAVVAVFRLAVAEASRSPDIAALLEKAGRQSTQRALSRWMEQAQADGLLGEGAPRQLAMDFLALTWEGLWVSLLLGVAPSPGRKAIEAQVSRATRSFLSLHRASQP